MGVREPLPGRAGLPGAGYQLQGPRHRAHPARVQGRGLQHRGAVEPDGAGQPGGHASLRPVEQGPGLPASAAGHAAAGLHLCTQGFPVNASTSRGDGARRVLRGWPGAGLLAQPPGSLVWGGLLFQIKRFHKALEMRLTCLPSAGRNGRWGAALLGLPSVQGEEDGCGGAHPELDHPAHKQLRVGA
ncbi:uncharacterized protein LOC109488738, partial [Ailuropoda melanoleuca]|uniref:uncharacterized protein LOC109488738 n=1 Tax=Ailuropoda melanoleuca TaxID=9646 RepID=UPI001495058B